MFFETISLAIWPDEESFVVRTPHHVILIDTCTGEDKGYPAPMDFPKQPWLDGLKAAGLGFNDIDYVFCTHLHIDHSGWNTVLRDGRWVPTFPKAKYIFHKREYAAWEDSTKREETRPGGGGAVFRMNCEPVVAAGQALLVDDDFALDNCLTLEPTPGHSPCHCCLHIKSGGQHAVTAGRGYGERLLGEGRLPRHERVHHDGLVGEVRCRHDDGIDIVTGEHPPVVGGRPRPAPARADGALPVAEHPRVEITQRNDARALRRAVRDIEQVGPQPESDHPDTQGLGVRCR